MEQSKGKSETYNYFYRLFTSKSGEGVAVITDKQCIALKKSWYHDELQATHEQLIYYITKKIKNIDAWYDIHDAHITFTSNSFYIDLPEFNINCISILQHKFIIDVLDAYEDVKRINPDIEKKRPLTLLGKYISDVKDLSEIRGILKDRIDRGFIPRKENIYELRWHNDDDEFVEVHNKESIKEAILYNIPLEKERLLDTLYATLYYTMPQYYNDSFYHDAFVELFPDFERMRDFSRFADKIPGAYREKISGVTWENLFEKLSISIGFALFAEPTSIEASFKTMHEGLSILYGFDKDNPNISPEMLAKIEQVYPNYGLLRTILSNPDIASRINDEDFKDKSGYEEVSKGIINLAYKEKQSEIEGIEQEIKELNVEQREIEKEEAFQRLYPKKEKMDEEVSVCRKEYESVGQEIKSLTEENAQHELIVSPESNTLFQKIRIIFFKIINRSKIKKSKESISANTKVIEELHNKQKECEIKLEKAKRKSLQVDIEFNRTSKDGTSLEQYKSQREARIQENVGIQGSQIADRKSKIQEKIQELLSVKMLKENGLKELLDTGLIDVEPVYANETHNADKESVTEEATYDE